MFEGLVLFVMLAPAHIRLFGLILSYTQKEGPAFTESIAGFWQPVFIQSICRYGGRPISYILKQTWLGSLISYRLSRCNGYIDYLSRNYAINVLII